MARKCTLLVLAMFATLFLQFADCMSPMTHDQQSMQCCGSMPCEPSNQQHDCCKTMVSSQPSGVLPTAHVALTAPTTIVFAVLPLPRVNPVSDGTRADLAAPQHSPPELYALHSSFLI